MCIVPNHFQVHIYSLPRFLTAFFVVTLQVLCIQAHFCTLFLYPSPLLYPFFCSHPSVKSKRAIFFVVTLQVLCIQAHFCTLFLYPPFSKVKTRYFFVVTLQVLLCIQAQYTLFFVVTL